MFTKLGIYAVLISFFVGVFTGISRFMKADNIWVDLTLYTFTQEHSEAIIQFIPLDFVKQGLGVLIYEAPLAVVILGLGIIFFIMAAFVKEY